MLPVGEGVSGWLVVLRAGEGRGERGLGEDEEVVEK
jgi:hypothetical protein